MRKLAQRLAVAVTLLLALAGCGDDAESGESSGQAPEVDCPYEEFGTVYTPTDWVAGVASVCHTTDQGAVLLINDSALLLDVAAGSRARLKDMGHGTDDTFAGLVNQEAAGLTTAAPGHWVIPPGGWVVAEGQPATIQVGVPVQSVALAYATSKLAGFAENRLTPGRATAKSVATCAQDVATAWGNAQDPSVGLDYLLADTVLGASRSCVQLLDSLSADDPPPRTAGALSDELAKVQSKIRATLWDDLVAHARNFVQVLR